ncbi:MAG: AraC family transcriptional regulator [Flavobacteriales bacterium]|nr:AraC family transcriptional regulator [Flavobacteriales bacterium]
MMKHIVLFSLFGCLSFNNRFTDVEQNKDSLSSKKYEYLAAKTIEFKKDTNTAKIYAKAWLAKAKMEKNNLQTIKAFRSIMYFEHKSLRINYSDSLLIESFKSKDNALIGNAYLSKGIIYYDAKQLKLALNNYIVANNYLIQTNDEYAKHKVKYSMAHTKYYLGFYDEAIALFNECINYFKEENDRAYINTIHSIALCYTKKQDYIKSSELNKKGVKLAKELEIDEMTDYFILSEGVNLFFNNNFEQAIVNLNKCLPALLKRNDKANLSVAYFYLAKCYWEQNEKEKAFFYLKKVESIIEDLAYLRPDIRENFELLLKYYINKKDKENQLKYIKKLMHTDSMLAHNFKYLSGKIFKEFDTAKLLEEKERIEKEKDNLRYIFGGSIVVALSTILVLLRRNAVKEKKNLERFNALMKKSPEENEETKRPINKEVININPDVIKSIVENLEKFEKSKKIIAKDLNIHKLATILNTNPKYAAKIILLYRHKKSIDYISELKINYIIERLKNEKKYRNYTNAALAEEAGFSSTQNFTKAFKKITGISPTFFIENLNKQSEGK